MSKENAIEFLKNLRENDSVSEILKNKETEAERSIVSDLEALDDDDLEYVAGGDTHSKKAKGKLIKK